MKEPVLIVDLYHLSSIFESMSIVFYTCDSILYAFVTVYGFFDPLRETTHYLNICVDNNNEKTIIGIIEQCIEFIRPISPQPLEYKLGIRIDKFNCQYTPIFFDELPIGNIDKEDFNTSENIMQCSFDTILKTLQENVDQSEWYD